MTCGPFSRVVHFRSSVRRPFDGASWYCAGSTQRTSQLIHRVPHGHGRGHFLLYDWFTICEYSWKKSMFSSRCTMSGLPCFFASSPALFHISSTSANGSTLSSDGSLTRMSQQSFLPIWIPRASGLTTPHTPTSPFPTTIPPTTVLPAL